MRNREISSEILLNLFDYDNGVLIWKANTGKKNKIGTVAGCDKGNGYISVGIFGRRYLAHRIVWIMHNGAIPSGMQIDHINHDRSDNRIENLRVVSNKTNAMNQGLRSNNTSGVTGVNWNKRKQKWCAEVWSNGKKIHVGYFSEIIDAENAVKDVRCSIGFHENHGRNM